MKDILVTIHANIFTYEKNSENNAKRYKEGKKNKRKGKEKKPINASYVETERESRARRNILRNIRFFHPILPFLNLKSTHAIIFFSNKIVHCDPIKLYIICIRELLKYPFLFQFLIASNITI